MLAMLEKNPEKLKQLIENLGKEGGGSDHKEMFKELMKAVMGSKLEFCSKESPVFSFN